MEPPEVMYGEEDESFCALCLTFQLPGVAAVMTDAQAATFDHRWSVLRIAVQESRSVGVPYAYLLCFSHERRTSFHLLSYYYNLIFLLMVGKLNPSAWRRLCLLCYSHAPYQSYHFLSTC